MGEEAERADGDDQVADRRQILAQVMEQDGLTAEVAAFADYFGVPLVVQLKHPLVLASLGKVARGPNGMEVGVPVVEPADGAVLQSDVLEFNLLKGAVLLQPSNTGQRLVILITNERYTVEVTVDPAEILYVSRITPSMMPQPSLIQRP